MITKYQVLFVSLIFALYACDKEEITTGDDDKESVIEWGAAADSSSSMFIYNYWNVADSYFNYNNTDNKDFHYWPQAHALDLVIDAYHRTNDGLYLDVIDKWYEGVKAKNNNSFLNSYYDDMEWNALAMLRAYKVNGQARYKNSVLGIWEDIKTGWNENGGGGIAWEKNHLYSKNACSNGPASILASRLFREFGDEENKQWALDIYAWEKENLFNLANGAVYDNLNAETGEVNSSWIFTYNQGTFLGAALELYDITGEKPYLNDAIKAADYTLNNLVNSSDQVLKSEGEGDGGLFKGVFVRYFTILIQHPNLPEGTKNRYRIFLEHNAKVLWQEGTNKQLALFGPYWKTKPQTASDLTTQTSGGTLIEAMTLLDSED